MHSKDEVNELVRRLAALRPDLAVVPRVLTPLMEQEADIAYHRQIEAEDEAMREAIREHGGAPATVSLALQNAFTTAIRVYDEELALGEVPPAMSADIATVLSKLVAEAYPEDKVLFRTMNGDEYTGGSISAMIRAGTDQGKDYASSILRVCRDIISRQAQRESAKGLIHP